mgnify:CR=1 FL=1
MRLALRCCLLMAALLLPANLAAERIERTFKVSPSVLVDVQSHSGIVSVKAWEHLLVQVVAVRRSRAVEIHLEQSANRVQVHSLLLQTHIPGGERTVDYEIWMPASAALYVHLDAGRVEVAGLQGDVKIETLAAAVSVHSLAGHTDVTTTSGNVIASNCSGRLGITSVSGEIGLLAATSRVLTARTASGDIRYEGELVSGGSYEFSNHQGAIALILPASASFELTARSVQGEVINEFPIAPKPHGRVATPGYAHSLLGTVQNGAAMVRASTFSGKITIQKR